MKRKLNENDAPEPVKAQKPSSLAFGDLGLDVRLLQAVNREKFAAPTPIQQQAIPLALQGKDILARAKTGSGKTLAYLLPILHTLLLRKAPANHTKHTSALILVPTKELASQVTAVTKSSTAFCAQQVRAENITLKEDVAVTRTRLAEGPDVVLSTPSRALHWVNEEVLRMDQLKHVVIDEADLLLSYGYEDDLRSLAAALPSRIQLIVVSATLQSTSALIELFYDATKEAPSILDLSAEEAASTAQNTLAQYLVRTSEDDKFLLLYAMLKLKLVTGKIIVFVADVDRAYRVKLFLEQFGIRSCVLNGELPVNSRMHVVEEFTRGVYDILVTADEIEPARKVGKTKKPKVQKGDEESVPAIEGEEMDETEREVQEAAGEDVDQENDSTTPTKPQKKRRGQESGAEFTLSRGLDIRHLACVLNFDLPATLKSYIHRIGRTARAGKSGMAVSFYVPKELYGKHKPTSIPQSANDVNVVKKIQKEYGIKDPSDSSTPSAGVQEWHFDMAKLEGFRYRLSTGLRNVTRIAIREARTRELRNELINSAKLQRHFEENPDDLRHLRHDHEMRTARRDPQLRHVPSYLLPSGGGKAVAGDVGYVGLKGDKDGKRKGGRSDKRKRKVGKGMDPLKSLNAKGKAKK